MIWVVVAILYAGMSVVAFVAYWLDKRAAGRGRPRIRERTLHLMELLGGWPGAWLAQRCFRHKTQDRWFRVVFWGIVGLHVAGWGLALYLRLT